LIREKGILPQNTSKLADIDKLPTIPALTGLRFLAAFFILFAHAFDWIAQFQDTNWRRYFSFVAMYGMPLFFVLSGFVIHYNYRRLFLVRPLGRAVCEFAAARFARIYPLYICILPVAILVDQLVAKTYGQPNLLFKILAYNITLTQSWWYVLFDGKLSISMVFGLAWSISTEMFFYAAYVAVVFLILRVSSPVLSLVATVSFAFSLTVIFVLSRVYLSDFLLVAQIYVPNYIAPQESTPNSFFYWFFYYSPYTRVFEFLLGCLTANTVILLLSKPVSRKETRIATAALATALVFLPLLGAVYLHVIALGQVNIYVQHLALNFLCAPPIAFIMFYVARYDAPFTRLMSSKVLVGLGETSYSIYLIHSWTLRIFFRPAPEWNWVWGIETVARIVVGILFTLLVAKATYDWIEVPGRVWLRDRLGRAIAATFDKRTQSQISPKDSRRQWGAVPGLALSPARRGAFTMAAIGALAVTAVMGHAAQSDGLWNKARWLWVGSRPEIEVVSASYGLSCKDFKVPASAKNTVAEGNVTKILKRACDMSDQCEFLVDAQRIGDPAQGCGKDFSVEYRCTTSQSLRSVYHPGEAHGKRVTLSCRADPR
jgi:peptidoglycan/LPS O-acetylase OafA/YrhL